MLTRNEHEAAADLLGFSKGRRFATILADPPWQFVNRTGKMAPEHRRLSRYSTLTLPEICALPVEARRAIFAVAEVSSRQTQRAVGGNRATAAQALKRLDFSLASDLPL
jgi:hypothetical protein